MPAAASNVTSTPSYSHLLALRRFGVTVCPTEPIQNHTLSAAGSIDVLDLFNGPTWVIIHGVNINRRMLGCLLLNVTTATLVIQRLQVVQYICREDSAPLLVRQNLVFVLSVPD